ncbi:MAG: SDR family NAD(P)-dependent oxidoreductase [Deltaproteobacteria bacterium]|nr:SDR family NAD(P)-dependent oxidoreductase [Deltaproteobacteria bacterium]
MRRLFGRSSTVSSLAGNGAVVTSYQDGAHGFMSAARLALAVERSRSGVDSSLASAAPIAVIGMSCRLAGGATTPDRFWRLLRGGADAVREVSRGRFGSLMGQYRAAFLEEVDGFDADFFGIRAAEAALMDPQHRGMLEVMWDAISDAALLPAELAGTRMGVFAATSATDFVQLTSGDDVGAFTLTGGAHAFAAGRASFLLDLKGPAVVVDTACSSSLYAVHLACRSIRSGECSAALVGAANLILSPRRLLALERNGMLAADGRSKTFDARADGFGAGEGFVAVVLKPLAAALAAGDPVLAVIRGTAANQDGLTSVVTAPNGRAQREVILAALENARVDPRAIAYVESHGTGTALGDPIEVEALAEVYGGPSDVAPKCFIGAVKTNVGHLEAASGLAGLVKTILCLVHESIPPNLHFESLNPHIQLGGSRLALPASVVAWPRGGQPRLAGVSSFGASGTNVHVVLEEAPRVPKAPECAPRAHLLPISARTEGALLTLRDAYVEALRAGGELSALDACHTAGGARGHHEHRVAVVGASVAELADRLEESKQSKRGVARGKLAFVFSGQGAQWPRMGMGLYSRGTAFRDAISECDRAFGRLGVELRGSYAETHPRGSILGALESGVDLSDTQVAQPCLVALEYALALQWRAWGIEPSAVVGHSVGELAAAAVAGSLSVDEAMRIAEHRGRALAPARGLGDMAAIQAPSSVALELIADFEGRVWIGGKNGPRSTVLSGEVAALDELVDRSRARGIVGRRLEVGYPFHSPAVRRFAREFAERVGRVQVSAPSVPMISTVDAGQLAVLSTEYLERNIILPVAFDSSIQSLIEQGFTAFLEIGPHPSLRRAIEESLESHPRRVPGRVVLGSLRRDDDEWTSMLRSLASLYEHGFDPRWAAVEDQGRRTHLPTQPWARQRFALPAESGGAASRAQPTPRTRATHPLRGERLSSPALSGVVFETHFSTSSPSYLADHVVEGRPILPLAATLELARAAVESEGAVGAGGADGPADRTAMRPEGSRMEIRSDRAARIALEDIVVPEAVVLNGDPRALQVVLRGDGIEIFQAPGRSHCGDGSEWRLHARMRRGIAREEIPTAHSLEELRGRMTKGVSIESHLSSFRRRGIELGPAFGSLRELWVGDGESLGRVDLGFDPDPSYGIHPVLLDGALQVLTSALGFGDGELCLPVSVERFELLERAPRRILSLATRRTSSGDSAVGSVVLFREDGRGIGRVEGIRVHRVRRGSSVPIALEGLLVELVFKPVPLGSRGESFRDLVHEAERSVVPLRALHRLERYEEARPSMDRLVGGYAARALASLRAEKQEGSRIRASQRHGRLLRRLEEISSRPWSGPGLGIEGLREQYPDLRSEVELMARCGERLGDVLCGRLDALELLFGGDGFLEMEALQGGSPVARALGALVSAVLLRLEAPAGRKLRVLELGAGTGGTTRYAVEALAARCEEYLVTDVSPIFVKGTNERFLSHGFVRGAVFDLERDPESQGMELSSFDVVLAANVLHATSGVEDSVRRAKSLLRPGGILMLVEGARSESWVDVTFGLTEGWWNYRDPELRTDGPLLDGPSWLRLLSRLGFDETGWVRCGGSLDQSLIMARAGEQLSITGSGESVVCVTVGAGESTQVGPRVSAAFGNDPMIVEATERSMGSLRARPIRDVVLLSSASSTDPAVEVVPLSWIHRELVANVDRLLWVVRELAGRHGDPPRLWIVTRGAAPSPDRRPHDAASLCQSVLWGIGRTIAVEHPELRCTLVDLDPNTSEATSLDQLVSELRGGGSERQVCFRGGVRFVARLQRVTEARSSESTQLVAATPGALDSLCEQPSVRRAPGPGEVEVKVASAGLNFRDVLNALGMYPGPSSPLGGELAGVVARVGEGVVGLAPGDEVLGLGAGAFGRYVTTLADLVVRAPPKLSLRSAVTLPAAFLTAYHGLVEVAGLRRGERVLIHSAAGGLGLAAIGVARELGAEILATAGTDEKRSFLRSMGVEHVASSRDAGFVEELRVTAGPRPVDVVIGAVTAAVREATLGILASGSRYVEVGKLDVLNQEELARRHPGVSYRVVDLLDVAQQRPGQIQEGLRRMRGKVVDGSIVPGPRTDFGVEEASRAFKVMASGLHVGKLVLHRPRTMSKPRPEGGYVVTGGFGALGLEVAGWLVAGGAGTVVLMGRSSPSERVSARIAELSTRGTLVESLVGDVERREDVERALSVARAGGRKLRGVFHAAGTLDDGALLKLTRARFERVLGPKALGAWNLHLGTLEDDLDAFVLFSSVSGLLGSRGQANHAAANAFLDALAQERRARGLSAMSIDWGAWAEIGKARERELAGVALGVQGLEPMSPKDGMAAFEWLLSEDRGQVGVLALDSAETAREPGRDPALFEALLPSDGPRSNGGRAVSREAPRRGFAQALEALAPELRHAALLAFLRSCVARVLGTPDVALDEQKSFFDLGVDSLLAVELRNVLASELERRFQATLLFDHPTLGDLATHILREAGLATQGPGPAEPTRSASGASDPLYVSISKLSDGEAAELLLRELDRGDA